MTTFLSILNRGYFIETIPGNHRNQHFHYFCGPQELPGAVCPNCFKPLLRFVAFNTNDPWLNRLGTTIPEIPLLFCWTCNIAQEPFFYQMTDEGAITLIQYGQGGVETDFPYADYPIFFPGAPAQLVAIPNEVQELIRWLNANDYSVYSQMVDGEWDVPRHQIGGEPYLIQRNPDYRMRCPICTQPMPFLSSIGDQCLDPRGFTGNEFVQVIYNYCAKCKVIGAFQQTD